MGHKVSSKFQGGESESEKDSERVRWWERVRWCQNHNVHPSPSGNASALHCYKNHNILRKGKKYTLRNVSPPMDHYLRFKFLARQIVIWAWSCRLSIDLSALLWFLQSQCLRCFVCKDDEDDSLKRFSNFYPDGAGAWSLSFKLPEEMPPEELG